MTDSKDNGGIVVRGNKSSDPLGSSVFVGLRALDPFLQYSILKGTLSGPVVSSLGSSFLPQGPTSNTGISLLDNLELSPYRLALLGMAVGASAKHVFWRLAIGQEPLGPGPSAGIGVINSVANSLNTMFFVCSATSLAAGVGEGPTWAGWPQVSLTVGSVIFVTGLLVETVSEIQRAVFKSKVENKGKPYTTGLNSIVRHPNYLGYTLWRAGFALAGGGWTLGLANLAFYTTVFTKNAIPELNEYCERRYADMWNDYKAKTPYTFIPYVL